MSKDTLLALGREIEESYPNLSRAFYTGDKYHQLTSKGGKCPCCMSQTDFSEFEWWEGISYSNPANNEQNVLHFLFSEDNKIAVIFELELQTIGVYAVILDGNSVLDQLDLLIFLFEGFSS